MAMVTMIPSPDPLCAAAFGLTALLALRAEGAPGLGGFSLPGWLPMAVLALFALGSGVLAIADPLGFAESIAGS
jgi:hypothetical protein